MSSPIKDDLRCLIAMIDEVIAICDAPGAYFSDKKLKYEIVFGAHSSKIKPMLDRLGIEFDWCDPDDSYERDVQSYRDSLDGFRRNVAGLIGDEVTK